MENTVWDFAASGNGAAKVITPRLPMQALVSGTIGGGTVTFEVLHNGSYIPAKDSAGNTVSITAVGVYGGFRASQGETIRSVLTGATTPTLRVELREVV